MSSTHTHMRQLSFRVWDTSAADHSMCVCTRDTHLVCAGQKKINKQHQAVIDLQNGYNTGSLGVGSGIEDAILFILKRWDAGACMCVTVIDGGSRCLIRVRFR